MKKIILAALIIIIHLNVHAQVYGEVAFSPARYGFGLSIVSQEKLQIAAGYTWPFTSTVKKQIGVLYAAYRFHKQIEDDENYTYAAPLIGYNLSKNNTITTDKAIVQRVSSSGLLLGAEVGRKMFAGTAFIKALYESNALYDTNTQILIGMTFTLPKN
jgi:hypothetical protein